MEEKKVEAGPDSPAKAEEEGKVRLDYPAMVEVGFAVEEVTEGEEEVKVKVKPRRLVGAGMPLESGVEAYSRDC
jgi:preprotein translocase subunit Sec61beta